MNELNLRETKHPNKAAQKEFAALVGIDEQKNILLQHLHLFFDPQRYELWRKKHHREGLPAFDHQFHSSPMFLLSGEVGCGKTALAQSIATPLSELVNKPIFTLETPSNIRGSGRVGELSNRITETFSMAQRKVSDKHPGILIIDEADDLATSRAQNQAHHEDRAGLNVLIKQIDLLKTDKHNLAVILITNRAAVLDPAVLRRAEIQLAFERPHADQYRSVFSALLQGTKHSKSDLNSLVSHAEKKKPRYTYSDLVNRVGKTAFREAVFGDTAFGPEILETVLARTEPTPLLTEESLL